MNESFDVAAQEPATEAAVEADSLPLRPAHATVETSRAAAKDLAHLCGRVEVGPDGPELRQHAAGSRPPRNRQGVLTCLLGPSMTSRGSAEANGADVVRGLFPGPRTADDGDGARVDVEDPADPVVVRDQGPYLKAYRYEDQRSAGLNQ
jgi:hypothetical protein